MRESGPSKRDEEGDKDGDIDEDDDRGDGSPGGTLIRPKRIYNFCLLHASFG